jgi:hypothetical protein
MGLQYHTGKEYSHWKHASKTKTDCLAKLLSVYMRPSKLDVKERVNC